MLLLIGSVGDSRYVYICFLLIQKKFNRRPSGAEIDISKSFQCPKFCRKELWLFKDYQRNPEIVEL